MQPFTGEIKVFGFGYPPRNYASCDGQIVGISQNTALFSILGTQYGGNGQTNFGLPDLRGNITVSQGQGPGLSDWVVGEQRGEESVILLTTEMPAHSHGLNAVKDTGDGDSPEQAVLGRALKGTFQDSTIGRLYSAGAPDTMLRPDSVAASGGTQSHPNMMPFLTINYCIALMGIFPARN